MKFRVSSFEFRVKGVGAEGALSSRHPSPVTRHLRNAFTLIELLTVIVIIGILAAILAPAVSHLIKGDNTLAANRQMLDDCARARQMAISQRTTVYMVFIPTNFWKTTLLPYGNWTLVPPAIRSSTIVTQLYAAQWTGYAMYCTHAVGDQPGKSFPRDLLTVKTLPERSYIAPLKFPGGPQSAPQYKYPPAGPVTPFRIWSNINVYSFLTTTNIPFPTADMLTNPAPPTDFITLPYIAFNYLGQLVGPDGNILPYDETIPLVHGTITYWRDLKTKAPIQPTAAQPAVADITESPPGNGTNISYNVIYIDRLTGRARLERQEVQ